MPELELQVALNLAVALTTIGHPYRQEAIEATAMDLVRWCKGKVENIDGQIMRTTPAQQASDLIREARETWKEWPERGGTGLLFALFREKYAPPARENSDKDCLAKLIQNGSLAAPCDYCTPGDPYCQYGGPKNHGAEIERVKAEAARHKPTLPKNIGGVDGFQQVVSVKSLTAEEMREALQADIRRKQEQLGRLGLD